MEEIVKAGSKGSEREGEGEGEEVSTVSDKQPRKDFKLSEPSKLFYMKIAGILR